MRPSLSCDRCEALQGSAINASLVVELGYSDGSLDCAGHCSYKDDFRSR